MRFLGCLVVAVLTCAGRVGAQSPAPLSLTWDAPPSCPTASQVRSDVLRLVGDDELTSRLQCKGTVRFVGGGWRLELQTNLDGREGERVLEGRACNTLSNAAAVTMALMLNPTPSSGALASLDSTEPAAPPPRLPVTPPIDDTPAQLSTSTRTRDTRKARFAIAAAGGVDLGNVPSLDPQAALGLSLAIERWTFALWAFRGLAQDAPAANRASAGGRLTFDAVRASSCWRLTTVDWLRISPCLGLGLNRITGRGTGIQNPLDADVFWTGVDAGVRLALPVHGPLSLLALVGTTMPLARPRISIDDLGEVARVAPLTGRAHLGAEIRFW